MNFDAILGVIPCNKSKKSSHNTFCKAKKAKGNKSIMKLTGLISKRVSTAYRLPGGKNVLKVSTQKENTK